ncbi:MAG TPA: hypothetical protein O0X39_04200 [Methanocorpusculum sp.]|nr:hypothetical protein [Methanocorpusculum sp.]
MAGSFRNYRANYVKNGRYYRNRASYYGWRGARYAYNAGRSVGRRVRAAGRGVVRYQTRANQGFGPKGFKVYPDLPLAGGVLVGMTNIDRQIPGEVILTGAALPIGGKYGRSVRNFFGGVILGELLSKITGKSINFPATTKTNSVSQFYA